MGKMLPKRSNNNHTLQYLSLQVKPFQGLNLEGRRRQRAENSQETAGAMSARADSCRRRQMGLGPFKQGQPAGVF